MLTLRCSSKQGTALWLVEHHAAAVSMHCWVILTNSGASLLLYHVSGGRVMYVVDTARVINGLRALC